MLRKLLIILVWLYSISANAGLLLVKISNKVFSVKLSADAKELDDLSTNQLIDLIKSADAVNEVQFELIEDSLSIENTKAPGTWTEAKTSPGTWTEAKKIEPSIKNIKPKKLKILGEK